jgi:hypothetical protein
MLSFEIVDNGDAIQIYCDQDGLKNLLGILEKLREADPDHIHLRTPSCGGSELSEHNPWGTKGVSEVIITTGGD